MPHAFCHERVRRKGSRAYQKWRKYGKVVMLVHGMCDASVYRFDVSVASWT